MIVTDRIRKVALQSPRLAPVLRHIQKPRAHAACYRRAPVPALLAAHDRARAGKDNASAVRVAVRDNQLLCQLLRRTPGKDPAQIIDRLLFKDKLHTLNSLFVLAGAPAPPDAPATS